MANNANTKTVKLQPKKSHAHGRNGNFQITDVEVSPTDQWDSALGKNVPGAITIECWSHKRGKRAPVQLRLDIEDLNTLWQVVGKMLGKTAHELMLARSEAVDTAM